MKKTSPVVLLTAVLVATALAAAGCRGRDAMSGDMPAAPVATVSVPAGQGQLVPQPVDTRGVDADLAGVDEALKQVNHELVNADRSPEDSD